MKLIKVDGIPKVIRNRCTKEELYMRLDTIMNANTHFLKVVFTNDEYSNVFSAQNSLNVSAERWDYPLRFHIRNGELYARRTDM